MLQDVEVEEWHAITEQLAAVIDCTVAGGVGKTRRCKKICDVSKDVKIRCRMPKLCTEKFLRASNQKENCTKQQGIYICVKQSTLHFLASAAVNIHSAAPILSESLVHAPAIEGRAACNI